MNKSQQELLDFVKESPRRAVEVSERFGCTTGTATGRLNVLRDRGFLRVSVQRTTYVYEVHPNLR